MDLTKITTPFGLLDPETQAALKAHGGPYERYSCEAGEGFFDCQSPLWLQYVVYRVKSQPLTKPSIDWSHVAPEFKWLARDQNGSGYIYRYAPEIREKFWTYRIGGCLSAKFFASYRPGTCDWRDSLVERPA